MKKVYDDTIADLLEVVDKDLIAGYEQKQSLKETLKWTNALYKVVCRERDALRRKYVKLGYLLISLIAGLVFIAYADTGGVGMMILVEAFGLVALMAVWMFLVLRSLVKEENAASSCLCVLEDFRATVYALDPTASSYSGDSVRAMLVDAACGVLVAQRLLEKHGQYSAEVQVNSYHFEEYFLHVLRKDCVLNFNQRVRAVAEFGLVFKKAELFRDAAAFLDTRG